jgi:hypothetical protein
MCSVPQKGEQKCKQKITFWDTENNAENLQMPMINANLLSIN